MQIKYEFNVKHTGAAGRSSGLLGGAKGTAGSQLPALCSNAYSYYTTPGCSRLTAVWLLAVDDALLCIKPHSPPHNPIPTRCTPQAPRARRRLASSWRRRRTSRHATRRASTTRALCARSASAASRRWITQTTPASPSWWCLMTTTSSLVRRALPCMHARLHAAACARMHAARARPRAAAGGRLLPSIPPWLARACTLV